MAMLGGPDGLQTLGDLELEGMTNRGPALDREVGANLLGRGTRVPGTVTAQLPQPADVAVRWDDLQQRHEEWDGPYWAECRALYAGGKRLLCDPDLLKRLFPSHQYEDPAVYAQRVARAHYFPYAGTIVDKLLAGLASDPLRVEFGETDEKTGVTTIAESDLWWAEFVKDVTDEADNPGSDDGDDEGGCSSHHFLVEALREAMQTRTTWILADMPTAPADPDLIDSALAEREAGLNEPYLCLVPAEHVIDWEVNDDGELEWALTLTQRRVRAGLRDRRSLVRHTYVLWSRDDWARFVVDVDPARPPAPDATIEPVDVGAHPFGRVPLERVQLPEGLWAMGKLHSLAREHFNKRCAMSWAEYKALFAILYEFLAPEDKNGLPVANAQQDSGRGTNQIRGQGYTQLRGNEDDARYVGPDAGPFKEARESCNDLMREMHRLMFSMGLSANMDSAALSRSGESKEQDSEATKVILAALGLIMRRLIRAVLALVAMGRGEPVPPCRVAGLEHFDAQGIADSINEAVLLFSGVPIASPTFREIYLANLYTKILGDGVTDEQRAKIREEIQQMLPPEAMALGLSQSGAPGTPGVLPEGDGDDEDEDDSSDKPVKPARKPGAPRRMGGSMK